MLLTLGTIHLEPSTYTFAMPMVSFQAPAFYEKRGYVCVGVVDGYPGGAQKIFMRKSLLRPAG
jgi:hypothetical protein